jgi:hypothetical protein
VPDALFTDSELFTGDAMNPDFEQVCPSSVIAELTAAQREQRVVKLVE